MKETTATRMLFAMLLLTLLSAACGGEPVARLDPATIPTITPTSVTPAVGQGEFLAPLQEGQTVVGDDGRYTITMPADWYAIEVDIAEEFWVEPPAVVTADPEITVNIVRENLDGVENPRQYAEVGQQHGTEIYKGIVTISSEAVRVGDRPAWRWIFTADIGKNGTFYYQLFIIDGRQGFVLTGSAPKDANEQQVQSLFDSIAGSLTFVRG